MNYTYMNNLFPNDIYELYSERLVADEPPTDCIIASIKYQMFDIISSGWQQYRFNYDANEWLFSCDDLQKVRVLDQVIKFFRSRGIGCYVDNTLKFNGSSSVIPAAGFVYPNYINTNLVVQWYVRQGQEYMKAYFY